MRRDLHDDWVAVRDEIEQAFELTSTSPIAVGNAPCSILENMVIEVRSVPTQKYATLAVDREINITVRILSWR